MDLKILFADFLEDLRPNVLFVSLYNETSNITTVKLLKIKSQNSKNSVVYSQSKETTQSNLKHFVMQKFKDKDFSNCDIRHNGYVEMRLNQQEVKKRQLGSGLDSMKEDFKEFQNVNLLRIADSRSKTW